MTALAFARTLVGMRFLALGAVLVFATPGSAQQLRHDVIPVDVEATGRHCRTLGEAWVFVQDAPGIGACVTRYRTATVQHVVHTDRTRTIRFTSEVEEDMYRAVWVVFDGYDMRMLGPVTRNMTLLEANGDFISMIVQDHQIVMTVVPPGTTSHDLMRDLAREMEISERSGTL